MSGEPACIGRSWLFLSTDLEDHERAASICVDCPALVWCMKETGEALRSIYGLGVHGTWAGKLYKDGRRTSQKSDGNCPQCGARDGHRCVSPTGVKLSANHRARAEGFPACKHCGGQFQRTRSRIRYCSDYCAKRR